MLNENTKFIVLAGVLGASLLSLSPAQAQSVEPMRFELAPTGTASQTTLQVRNTRPFPITIEAVPSVLTIDANGEETLVPADDDFLIFPPQAVIDAGKTQSIRVRYIGGGALDTSKAYRININQLPIDMREDGESGVAVTVNFATLVNVVPSNVKSDLAVSELSSAEDGRWRMLVTNNGNRYARMPDLDMRISQGSRTSDISSNATQGWFDRNLILPGGSLYVTMPAQEGFDPQQTTIELVEPS
jgi:P pilus assembly chaperone PapD